MLSTCRRGLFASRNYSRGCFAGHQRHALRQPPSHHVMKRHSSGTNGVVVKMLKRGVYTTLMVVGVPGVAYLLITYWMHKQSDKYTTWMKSYYPANLSDKVSERFKAISDWFKSTSPSTATEPESPSASASSSSSSTTSDDGGGGGGDTLRTFRLTQEIKTLKDKNMSLEKENQLLRKELSKLSGTTVRPGGQKTLIELYTDVLNLLTEFDAKSPITDRKLAHSLPQVVVVGDQSSGKTSVLEMVANARIFPRGAGEMMTRAPVMVTLGEGPEHVAMFNDSSKVYNLKKEDELRSLRSEIEERMRRSVAGGKTVSAQPIPLTVKGPQLKRMVLIDLPGVINTVTTGMAANTREEIIKMSRLYMQNPNAIILCIQDGSVDAERSIVTDLVSHVDPDGQRTIFVLTKVDMAEHSGMKQERVLSILDGQLFPMKALGYFAVVAGRGNATDSIEQIQRYEREYFAKSKLFQNGLLHENQLTTRTMVNAVTEEFWKVVRESINDEALLFKTLRYNLEAEWRNKYPGERTLDRGDLFELGKADILTQVASLQVLPPTQWEDMLMECMWQKMGDKVLDDIFMRAAHSRSSDQFNTVVDIELHKWADSLQLATMCADVGMATMFEQLHSKLTNLQGGKFHLASQGLREEIERVSRELHKWEPYNVDQLKYVQMSTLDDKDVRSADQWKQAVKFMESSLNKQIKQAEEDIQQLQGPVSLTERWLRWTSQSAQQVRRQAIVDELSKYLSAEPNHPNKLFSDELLTVQRSLKNQGLSVTEEEILYTWNFTYKLHFLRQAKQKAQKCQKGFLLREHSIEYSCPEVTFFWRVQQVMQRSAHTLRVQILDKEVRQLEQQVKLVLDSISADSDRKRELIRGEAVDKAEQLKQVRLIQESLDTFRDALSKQQKQS